MAVASRFGWAAVSGGPMDWVEYHAALQLIAEERVGRAARRVAAEEDDEFAESRRNLQRSHE